MRPNPSMRLEIGALVLATSVVQLANGFFGTFIALRIPLEDFGATLTGLVLSSYFAGFTAGAVRSAPIIARVGHIRAYAAFAGLVAAATAAMPLLIGALPWLILRAIVGFGCAGIFITTESWLNAKASSRERGRVLSFYMVGTFAALAVGQLLIGTIDAAGQAPFNAIVALFAIALVVVSTTRAEAPRTQAGPSLPFGLLVRAAPIAVLGAALSGMMAGTFYALVPAWMQVEGIDAPTIALLMFAAVVGGLAFQVPVGRLSDRFDRRRVLVALGLGLAGAAILLVCLPHALAIVLPAAALLGGFLSTLYPVCLAYAHDCLPPERVVAVSSRLILMSGIGSVLGPLLGTGFKSSFGIDGVLYFIAATAAVLALASLQGLRLPAPAHQDRQFDVLSPQASSLVHDAQSGSAQPSPPPPDADVVQ
jgi:MFS family permease